MLGVRVHISSVIFTGTSTPAKRPCHGGYLPPTLPRAAESFMWSHAGKQCYHNLNPVSKNPCFLCYRRLSVTEEVVYDGRFANDVPQNLPHYMMGSSFTQPRHTPGSWGQKRLGALCKSLLANQEISH